jgi:hypothetical protein
MHQPAAKRCATPGRGVLAALPPRPNTPPPAPGPLQVPQSQWERTPLHLMATAGLRMLPDEQAARILEEARRTLAASGFLFRDAWARIITGQQEGLFGWASINYATGALQVGGCFAGGRLFGRLPLPSRGGRGGRVKSRSKSNKRTRHTAYLRLQPAPASSARPCPPRRPQALAQQQQQAALGRRELPGGLDPIKPTQPLLGVLDLGGASLQVTFVVDGSRRRIPPNQAAELEVPGLAQRQLYSHSFDGFGMQARGCSCLGWGMSWQVASRRVSSDARRTWAKVAGPRVAGLSHRLCLLQCRCCSR